VPSLAACLQEAAGAAQLTPNPMAYTLYNLGKRVDMDTGRGSRLSVDDRSAVVATASRLVEYLLGISQSSAVPPILELDSKHLSLVAWSLSALTKFDESVLNATARELCYALAERASQPGVMRARADVACRNLAGVLYGIATASIKCSDNPRVQEVFSVALEQELPDLLKVGQKCVPQDVSNIVLACLDAEYKGSMEPFISAVAGRVGKRGGGGDVMAGAWPQAWSNLLYACAKLEEQNERELGKGMGVLAREGAAAMAEAVQGAQGFRVVPQEVANTLWGFARLDWYDDKVIRVLAAAMVERVGDSKPQAISNTLWALAKFEWYDQGIVSKLATAMVERVGDSKPQDISNTLWALSALGWYDPAVYDQLLVGLLKKGKQAEPQALSNAYFACAIASHGSSVVNGLSQLISVQDVSEQDGWKAQDVANILYAWAVQSSMGMTSGSLDGMARHLMSEVNGRGPVAYSNKLDLTQLYVAHLEAEHVGLQGGGLSTANNMLQAAAGAHREYQAELRKVKQSGGGVYKQIAGALGKAGYEVEHAVIVGEVDYFANLLVRHESCPRGIALDVVSETDAFHQPPGQLSGKIKHKQAQISQHCDGLVVVSEAEVPQPQLVVQRLEQELSRARMC
jgi:hypothetical protein